MNISSYQYERMNIPALAAAARLFGGID